MITTIHNYLILFTLLLKINACSLTSPQIDIEYLLKENQSLFQQLQESKQAQKQTLKIHDHYKQKTKSKQKSLKVYLESMRSENQQFEQINQKLVHTLNEQKEQNKKSIGRLQSTIRTLQFDLQNQKISSQKFIKELKSRLSASQNILQTTTQKCDQVERSQNDRIEALIRQLDSLANLLESSKKQHDQCKSALSTTNQQLNANTIKLSQCHDNVKRLGEEVSVLLLQLRAAALQSESNEKFSTSVCGDSGDCSFDEYSTSIYADIAEGQLNDYLYSLDAYDGGVVMGEGCDCNANDSIYRAIIIKIMRALQMPIGDKDNAESIDVQRALYTIESSILQLQSSVESVRFSLKQARQQNKQLTSILSQLQTKNKRSLETIRSLQFALETLERKHQNTVLHQQDEWITCKSHINAFLTRNSWTVSLGGMGEGCGLFDDLLVDWWRVDDDDYAAVSGGNASNDRNAFEADSISVHARIDALIMQMHRYRLDPSATIMLTSLECPKLRPFFAHFLMSNGHDTPKLFSPPHLAKEIIDQHLQPQYKQSCEQLNSVYYNSNAAAGLDSEWEWIQSCLPRVSLVSIVKLLTSAIVGGDGRVLVRFEDALELCNRHRD